MNEAVNRTDWFKSSHSAENPACVEIRFSAGATDVRDSKDPAGPTLSFPRTAWAKFVRR